MAGSVTTSLCRLAQVGGAIIGSLFVRATYKTGAQQAVCPAPDVVACVLPSHAYRAASAAVEHPVCLEPDVYACVLSLPVSWPHMIAVLRLLLVS